MRELQIVDAGPLTTVQDLGRPGYAALGVGESGAADRRSFRLGNRLLGNPETAGALEVTLGGLAVRARGELFVAVTGAPAPLTIESPAGGRRAAAVNTVIHLPDGARLRLGLPAAGLRSYLAVRGGIDVPPVLGSRATDTLSGIGPDRPRSGALLPVGPPPDTPPLLDVAPVPPPPAGRIELRIVPGPRDDWFATLAPLLAAAYEVTSDSNRIGMRLSGPALIRNREDELPSEGIVPGAVQVPPSGEPVLFLADHPVTGGYPVAAVLLATDVDRAAQARPGQVLRFRPAHPAGTRDPAPPAPG